MPLLWQETSTYLYSSLFWGYWEPAKRGKGKGRKKRREGWGGKKKGGGAGSLIVAPQSYEHGARTSWPRIGGRVKKEEKRKKEKERRSP